MEFIKKSFLKIGYEIEKEGSIDSILQKFEWSDSKIQ